MITTENAGTTTGTYDTSTASSGELAALEYLVICREWLLEAGTSPATLAGFDYGLAAVRAGAARIALPYPPEHIESEAGTTGELADALREAAIAVAETMDEQPWLRQTCWGEHFPAPELKEIAVNLGAFGERHAGDHPERIEALNRAGEMLARLADEVVETIKAARTPKERFVECFDRQGEKCLVAFSFDEEGRMVRRGIYVPVPDDHEPADE